MLELTANEKRLLKVLGDFGSADAETLADALATDAGAVVQWAHLAAGRGLWRSGVRFIPSIT